MNLTNLKNVKCSKISYHNVFPKLDIDRESHAYKNGGKRCSTPVAVYRSHDRAENKPANQSAVFQWKWRAGKTYSDWLAYLRLGHVTYIPLWPWPDFFHGAARLHLTTRAGEGPLCARHHLVLIAIGISWLLHLLIRRRELA